jgi:hypothetical protein
MIPAMCLALTNDVLGRLRNHTGKKHVEDIKKLDSKEIQLALYGSRFLGRPSTLTCTGLGTSDLDKNKQLVIVESKCPDFSACANADQIFYNMAINSPETQKPFSHKFGTSPVRTVPSPGVQQ